MVVLISFLSVYALIEKYLQECWPIVKGALKEHGVACELNLVGYLFLLFFYPSFNCSGFVIIIASKRLVLLLTLKSECNGPVWKQIDDSHLFIYSTFWTAYIVRLRAA